MPGQTAPDQQPGKRDEHRTSNGHVLIQVIERIPGHDPTDIEIDLSEADDYKTSYYRCQNCGQERNRPRDFREECATQETRSVLSDGGYSIEEPRTRRALTEQMDVRFRRRGPVYDVHAQSGATYLVNVAAKSCTCPDFARRGEDLGELGCKHLRRVELSIQAGVVPNPEGRFERRRR